MLAAWISVQTGLEHLQSDVNAPVLSDVHVLSHLISQLYRVNIIIIIPFLQMIELRHRDVCTGTKSHSSK